MPASSSSSLPLARVAAAALLVLGFGGSVAAEHAPAPKAAASAPSSDGGDKDGRGAKTVKADDGPLAKALARGPKDPMEMLRDKLAAKLGTIRTAPADDPSVVRVVSKASLTEADDPGTMTLVPHAVRRRPARVAAAVEPPRPSQWDYSGAGGPQSWGRLKPEFAKCSNGTRQSPIDIRDGIKVNLDPVQFGYKPADFRVLDNGRTVQVNVGPGSSIDVMGRHYELVSFDFQRPSEELIDGHRFDMGVHLVHRDSEGRLAVVAVLLERGSPQTVLQSVWNNLPLEKGDELAARTTVDLNDLLPADRGFFTYMGSMTAPPCSEGVLWMVMKQPVQVSPEQIDIFSRLYPMNARPVQSASGRLIKESN